MRISNYFMVFDVSSSLKLAYSSRTNALFEVTPKLYDFFSTHKNLNIDTTIFEDADLDFFIDQKILVHKGDDDAFVRELQFKTIQFGFAQEQLHLVIAPTTQCDFRCYYCFEPNKDQRVMGIYQIEALIGFVKKHKLANKISITWYGGEPLLAIDVMRRFLCDLRETGKELVRHDIITNGYHFNQEAIELFSEFPLDTIQVTLDGNKARHDSIRYNYCTGEGSFDKIIGNMERILTLLPDAFLSVRVNIDKNSQPQFMEVKNLLTNKWKDFSNFEVYPGIIRIDNEAGSDFANNGMKVSDTACFCQKLEESGYINNYPIFLNKSCTANRINAYVIGPSGEIYKCWNDVTDPEKIVGYIYGDNLINKQLFYDYLFSTAWYENSECKDCCVLPICHGGCSWYKHRNLRSNGHFVTCCMYKNIDFLKQCLINRYNQLGNQIQYQ